MSDTPLGRFAWYELLTTDPDAATSFYTQLLGWTTAPWEGGEAPYTLWMNGEEPIGGVMALPPEAVAGGAPPHWLGHISTPDVEATVATAKSLGAKVMHQADVPEVGAFAVLADPHGAVFAAYQPAGDTPGHDGQPKSGEVSWRELMANDWQEAWSFYSQTFGWRQVEQMDMGEMGMYHIFGRGDMAMGGMMTKPSEVPVAAWLFYFHVPSVDVAFQKAKSLGAAEVMGPMEVPGGDWIATMMDPQGAVFAVHGAK